MKLGFILHRTTSERVVLLLSQFCDLRSLCGTNNPSPMFILRIWAASTSVRMDDFDVMALGVYNNMEGLLVH